VNHIVVAYNYQQQTTTALLYLLL